MQQTGDFFGDPHARVIEPRAKRGAPKKKPVDLFAEQLVKNGCPEFEREVQFAKSIGRKWALDFANRAYRVAVEIEGLVVFRQHGELVVKGRHASITGFREDCVKYASAAMLGWTVLRFEQSMVKGGDAIEYTMRVLASKGWRRG